MARTRSIKPAFFKNEILAQLPFQDQLLFVGLWMLADREGRLEDRPPRIKAEVFPYREVDVESCLCRLHQTGFIVRYTKGENYISIPTWLKHQHVHVKEQPSTIPAPDKNRASTVLEPDITNPIENQQDTPAPTLHRTSPVQERPSTYLPSTLPPSIPEERASRLTDGFPEEMRTHLRKASGKEISDDLLGKIAASALRYKSDSLQAAAVFLDVHYRCMQQDGIKNGEAYLIAAFEKALAKRPAKVN